MYARCDFPHTHKQTTVHNSFMLTPIHLGMVSKIEGTLEFFYSFKDDRGTSKLRNLHKKGGKVSQMLRPGCTEPSI